MHIRKSLVLIGTVLLTALFITSAMARKHPRQVRRRNYRRVDTSHNKAYTAALRTFCHLINQSPDVKAVYDAKRRRNDSADRHNVQGVKRASRGRRKPKQLAAISSDGETQIVRVQTRSKEFGPQGDEYLYADVVVFRDAKGHWHGYVPTDPKMGHHVRRSPTPALVAFAHNLK